MDTLYQVALKEKVIVAKDTMLFHFEKPAGFIYKAGQFIELEQINPPTTDKEGNKRAFTLTSAPYEEDLMIATRIRETTFKQNLKNMEIGTKLNLTGPFGAFTLPNSSEKPIVYVIGGIGITPAHSVIKQATHDNLPHKIYLFYSNPTREAAAFLDEFSAITKQNPNFTFIPTMTQDEIWTGEKGRINKELVQKYLDDDFFKALYFTSGPAAMVTAMRTMLKDAGIDDDNIRSEEFPGY